MARRSYFEIATQDGTSVPERQFSLVPACLEPTHIRSRVAGSPGSRGNGAPMFSWVLRTRLEDLLVSRACTLSQLRLARGCGSGCIGPREATSCLPAPWQH